MTTALTLNSHRRLFTLAAAALTIWLGMPALAAAQARRLTLEAAIAEAQANSAAIDVARAGESRADADLQRANSQRLPQVSFTGSYDRTLASEFSAFESLGPPCAPLAVDPARPIADRVAEIERAATCGSLGASFNFAELPFGQRNIYRGTFSFAQALYAGGRINAQRRQAEAGRRAAELATSGAETEVALAVTQAYFDAALADRLVVIAEAGEQQAQAAFEQARLSVEAGRAPEFEMLRAQVARDNQRPIVIRRRADRDLAYLRLRQLLELPATETIVLDVDLDASPLPPPAVFSDALANALSGELDLTDRLGTRQAQAVVAIREEGVTVARSERKPAINLLSSFGRVGYPSEGAFPGADDFRTNWTLGAAVSVPLFTGFRLHANELSARADLAEAQAQLERTREIAELEAATARQDLTSAMSVWEASAGVVQQAQRAYEIADLRYREGISTQLELQDARLALQQAQANRTQAARDVQLARARLALLPGLPFGVR